MLIDTFSKRNVHFQNLTGKKRSQGRGQIIHALYMKPYVMTEMKQNKKKEL